MDNSRPDCMNDESEGDVDAKVLAFLVCLLARTILFPELIWKCYIMMLLVNYEHVLELTTT